MSTCATEAQATRGVIVKDGVSRFGNGSLEVRQGIPVLHLRGTPYETGLQYGVLLMDPISRVYAEFTAFRTKFLRLGYQGVPWFVRPLAPLLTKVYLAYRVDTFVKRIPAGYLEHMRGMADGSGIPLKEWLSVLFWSELSWNCSAAVIKDHCRVIHARNYDFYIHFMANYPLLIDCAMDGTIPFTSVGYVALPALMPVSAMNSEGVTLTLNMSVFADKKAGGGRDPICRYVDVLQSCRNLRQADSVIRAIHLKDSYIVTVASAADTSGAIFDAVGRHVARNDLRDGSVTAVNKCVADSLTGLLDDIEAGNYYNSFRQARLDALLREADSAGPVERAIRVVQDAQAYSYASPVPPVDATINNALTLHSVVMDPADRTIYFAYNAGFAAWGRWLKYDLRTGEMTVARERDARLDRPDVKSHTGLFCEAMFLNRRDGLAVRGFARKLDSSGLANLWALGEQCECAEILKDPAMMTRAAGRITAAYPDVARGYLFMAQGLLMGSTENRLAGDYLLKALRAPILPAPEKALASRLLAQWYLDTGDRAKAREYAAKAAGAYAGYRVSAREGAALDKLVAAANAR